MSVSLGQLTYFAIKTLIMIEINRKHKDAHNCQNLKNMEILDPPKFFCTSYMYLLKKVWLVFQSTNQNGGGGVNTTSIFSPKILFTNLYFTWIKHYFKLLKTKFFLNSGLPNWCDVATHHQKDYHWLSYNSVQFFHTR